MSLWCFLARAERGGNGSGRGRCGCSTQLSRRGLQLRPHAELSSGLKSGLKHTAPLGLLLFIHLLGCCSKCPYRALEDLIFHCKTRLVGSQQERAQHQVWCFQTLPLLSKGTTSTAPVLSSILSYIPKSSGRRGACLALSLVLWSLPGEELTTPDY